MMPEEKPPSADELLAMAYVDGELDTTARAAFEMRLAHDPLLAREVAAQRRLDVLARSVAPLEPEDHEWARLARSVAPLEPEDHEWARLARSSSRRVGFVLAWSMIAIGTLGLTTLCEVELLLSDAPVALKVFVTLILAGGLMLFGLVLRGRLKTRPFDPYVEVRR